jgi:hypothetical protein
VIVYLYSMHIERSTLSWTNQDASPVHGLGLESTRPSHHITAAMVGPFRCEVSTSQLQPCFARPGPQTAFGLSRAIHRASSLRSLTLPRCGAPVHCALRAFAPGGGGPTPLSSSCNRLSPKTASPWRNVARNSALQCVESRPFQSGFDFI